MYKNCKWVKVLTKEFLEEEYVKKQRSLNSIAISIGCRDVTVSRYCRRYNINIRTIQQQRYISNNLKLPVYLFLQPLSLFLLPVH